MSGMSPLCMLLITKVNGLNGVLKEKNLLHVGKIDVDITNCGVGIDASVYLRQVYSRDPIKSSLSSALGGIPAALATEVEKDLAQFKKQKVELVFVFEGLDLYNFNHKDDKGWKNDDLVANRKTAWDAWTKLAEKGRYADTKGREELASQAREAFESSIPPCVFTLTIATSMSPNVDRYLMEILIKHEIDFTVAPVSAKAQVYSYATILTIARLVRPPLQKELFRRCVQRFRHSPLSS
jgi:hypothetical protein